MVGAAGLLGRFAKPAGHDPLARALRAELESLHARQL
jgi:hypothetical protein